MQDLPPLTPPIHEPSLPDRYYRTDDRPDIVRDWQRRLDAREIGSVQPLSEATIAAIRATEAIICRRSRGGVW